MHFNMKSYLKSNRNRTIKALKQTLRNLSNFPLLLSSVTEYIALDFTTDQARLCLIFLPPMSAKSYTMEILRRRCSFIMHTYYMVRCCKIANQQLGCI